MKIRTYFFLFISPLFCSQASKAQGTFQNLGFESTVLVPVAGSPNGVVQFAPALPGWTGYIGGTQQTNGLYNSTALDTSVISVIDTNPPGWAIGVIQGKYSAVLQAGVGNGLPAADTTLLQNGIVPNTAQTLTFMAYFESLDGLSSLSVTLDGEILPLTTIQSGAPFTLYGADIHNLSGKSVDLAFTVLAQTPHQGNNTLFLDSITFSDQPIPEPSVLGLVGLGVFIFLFSRKNSCHPFGRQTPLTSKAQLTN